MVVVSIFGFLLYTHRLLSRLDTLSGKFKNEGKPVRWSQLDAYILVHKSVLFFHCVSKDIGLRHLCRIDSLNVHDDSEIDWKKLPDEHWNTWSPHTLQRRWVCMKRSIKGHEDMTHAGTYCRKALHRTFFSHLPSRTHGHPTNKKGSVTAASYNSTAQEDHKRGDYR